jgi:hypothetical protein
MDSIMKTKAVIRENTHLSRGYMDFGWGNGYVLLPEGHKYHGLHYDNIDVNVHGGLTFSELIEDEKDAEWYGVGKEYVGYWAVGFDTANYGDTLEKWTKEAVMEETKKLEEQLNK